MVYNAEADSYACIGYSQGAVVGGPRYCTITCRSVGDSWHCAWLGNTGINAAAANIMGHSGEYYRCNPTATKPDPIATRIRFLCGGMGFLAGTQVRIWGRDSL